MCTSLFDCFEKGEEACTLFTSVCPSIHQSVRPIFFVTTTIQGFLKFGFRVHISLLDRVIRFQIYHSTTSCLPNTCMILHMIAKLKIFVTFFSGTTIQGFLKFGFRVYISLLYHVMRFQIHQSTTSVFNEHFHIFTLLKLSTCRVRVSSVSSSSQFHLFFSGYLFVELNIFIIVFYCCYNVLAVRKVFLQHHSNF